MDCKQRRELNILMVLPTLRVSNGVGSFAMNYYRQLDHNVIHVDFVLYRNIDSPYISEIKNNGDNVVILPPVKKLFTHVKECKRVLQTKQYDIIHDNSLTITLPLMLLAKKRVPLRILHSHSTQLGENRKRQIRNALFIPFLRHTANAFAACSTIAGKTLFGRRRFEIIPDVIDVSNFRFNRVFRDEIRTEEQCEKKFIIGTVGRLADAKNPFFAIDVVEQVLMKRSDVEYWWIGSGGLDSKVEQYIKNKGLQKSIRLLGSKNEVSKYYQAMDLFFMPSKFEGFGMSCVEAETSGLQCVVSDQLSQEVNICGNVTYVPLNSNIKNWVSIILSVMDQKIDRDGAYFLSKDSICSNENAGGRITEYYYKIFEQSKEFVK